MNVEARIRPGASIAFDKESTDCSGNVLAARVRKAESQPEQFLEELEWSVRDDLSVVDQIERPSSMAAPFQSQQWLRAWLQTFGIGAQLRIVTGCIGSQPVLVLPLCIEKRGPFKRLCYVAQDVSDYNHPVMHHLLEEHASPEFLAALYRKAGELTGEADILYLRKLLKQPARNPGRLVIQSSRPEADATHWTQLSGERWDIARDRFFGRSTRRTLARKERKIAAGRPISFEVIRDKSERLEAMLLLASWKDKQLSELGMANPFLDQAFGAFLTETVRDSSPEEFRIYRFSAGDEAVALTFMICNGSNWFLYQTAYTDREAQRYSPGMILLREILREAHDEGAQIFDFGLGDEGYKQKYCDHHANLHRYQQALTRFGVLGMACSDAKFQLRSQFKSQGWLRSAALKFLRAVSVMRSGFRLTKRAPRALFGLGFAVNSLDYERLLHPNVIGLI